LGLLSKGLHRHGPAKFAAQQLLAAGVFFCSWRPDFWH
jgi:hypothetical protein